MQKNRSRTVTSKQALMAEQNPFSSPNTKNITKLTPFILGSPRSLNGLLPKIVSDTEDTVITQKSILDPKNSPKLWNPIFSDKDLSKPGISNKDSGTKPEPEATGLALIDSINEQNTCEKTSKAVNRMVMFGAKLKVQIPSTNSTLETPNPLGDFGIKTRDSQVFSPTSGTPLGEFSRQLSLKEMEMCEDYTCVINHGPNPKTTHIFDDCIVESCSGSDPALFDLKKMETRFGTSDSDSGSVDQLSLEQSKVNKQNRLVPVGEVALKREISS